MRIVPACLPCVFDDLDGAVRTLVADEQARQQIAVEALEYMAREYHRRRVPSYYITGVHRIIKRVTGVEMPFADLRHRANELSLSVSRRLTPPEDPEERFRFLIGWAVAGNHMDFRTVGTGYGLTVEQMQQMLDREVRQGLQVDDSAAILAAVRRARRIVYILDNVGEIAFDALLIEELQRYAEVVAAVRGGPITSDAVLEDALYVGLDRLAPLVVAGPDTLGISSDEMSDELRAEMAQADLIVTKGQANYYVIASEYQRPPEQQVACLLSTKCDLISRDFGLTGKLNVATLRG